MNEWILKWMNSLKSWKELNTWEKPQSSRGWWQQVMGKGSGQDGKLLAFKRSNPRQQADVLATRQISVAVDLATGNRWKTRQAGGWHRGFGKQVSGGAVLEQNLIALKHLSNRVMLLSQTMKVGIQRQREQNKRISSEAQIQDSKSELHQHKRLIEPSALPLSEIPLAFWTKKPCQNCWLSLFIVIYWSQLWG